MLSLQLYSGHNEAARQAAHYAQNATRAAACAHAISADEASHALWAHRRANVAKHSWKTNDAKHNGVDSVFVKDPWGMWKPTTIILTPLPRGPERQKGFDSLQAFDFGESLKVSEMLRGSELQRVADSRLISASDLQSILAPEASEVYPLLAPTDRRVA